MFVNLSLTETLGTSVVLNNDTNWLKVVLEEPDIILDWTVILLK